MFFCRRTMRYILGGWAITTAILTLAASVYAAQPGSSSLTPQQRQLLDEAQNLNDQAVRLYGTGKATEAIPFARRALALRQNILGKEAILTAQSMNNLGFLLQSSGDLTAARPYYESALAINRKLEGENSASTAAALNNLGFLIKAQGDIAGARTYYEQALKIKQIVQGKDHPDTALSHHNLGALLQALGDFAGARREYEQAFRIRKKNFGEEHADVATSLNGLGTLASAQGELDGARTYFEKALTLRRKVLGNDHPDTAISMDNLGNLLEKQADYFGARKYFDEALAVRKQRLGQEHPDYASTLNSLGFLFKTLGDYKAARVYFEQALKIRKKILGNKHPDTAVSWNNLGLVLNAQGDSIGARGCYEEALRISKVALGDEHPQTATTMDNVGAILLEQGDIAAARPYCLEALRIRKKVLGIEHNDTADSLHNMGYLHVNLNEFGAACPYYEQALAIKKKLHGESHPETAAALNGLATVHHHQGNFAAARPLYEESLRIHRKVFGENHTSTSLALNNLALLHQNLGDFAKARDHYQQSLQIKHVILGVDHPDNIASLSNMATLEIANGNSGKAQTLIDQLRRISRRHVARILPELSEREQLLFLQSNDEANFQFALSFALSQRERSDIVSQSASWLLNGKGVAHATLAEKTVLTRDLKNPQLREKVQQLLKIRQKLATQSLVAPPTGKEADRRREIDLLSAEEEQLSRQLSVESGRVLDVDPWIDLPKVRASLPADAALVDIARFSIYVSEKGFEKKAQPARYVAWIIPAINRGDVQIVDLGPAAAIDDAVESARRSIQTAADDNGLLKQKGEAEGNKSTTERLQKLADLIWKPLAPQLAGVKKLILSPDGALWLVPWGALPVENGRFLVEDYSLRYVISGREVVPRVATKLTRSPPTLFADPDFDLTPQNQRDAFKAVFKTTPIVNGDQVRGVEVRNALPQVARLPNTAIEAQAIAPSIERFMAQPQTYTDRYALEGIIKPLERPQLLVLSTHGFFLQDQEAKKIDSSLPNGLTRAASATTSGKPLENPLLRCGLLMAGCNAKSLDSGEDGVLTGMEIVGIDLRGTELVVLSACETGIGKVRNGEGVAGLRQAFQLAGAQAVVATLWQVPDRDSMLIMNDFFQHLADGQSRPEALRNAQLKRIQARRDKNGAAHPFYWAAWTFTGD